jgi:hypothetical protein
MQISKKWHKTTFEERMQMIAQNPEIAEYEKIVESDILRTIWGYRILNDLLEQEDQTMQMWNGWCFETQQRMIELHSEYRLVEARAKEIEEEKLLKQPQKPVRYLKEKCPFCRGKIIKDTMMCEACNTGFSMAPQKNNISQRANQPDKDSDSPWLQNAVKHLEG